MPCDPHCDKAVCQADCDRETVPLPPRVTAPMSAEDRKRFAIELRFKLDSHRTVFVVDKYMFEPYDVNNANNTSGPRVIGTTPSGSGYPTGHEQKTISAQCLKLLLDYCESPWDMDFVSYCAGMFHGREPNEGETAFDLLPDVKSRLSADRFGLGHIYGGE